MPSNFLWTAMASAVAFWAGLNLIYYVLLCLAALVRSKTIVCIVVAAAILYITGATVIFA
jgi:hypothetical protein